MLVILSTIATDALVLKHQVITTYSSEYIDIFIVLDQFQTKEHVYSQQH